MEEQEANEASGLQKEELLYHYTSQRGLLGILVENAIWATHINYLNDASEFKRGLGIVRRHVQKIRIDPLTQTFGNSPEVTAQFLEKTLRDSVGQALGIMDQVDVFVASFFDSSNCSSDRSAKDAGDVLEQWRAYSGDTVGISIGFDKSNLSDHIANIGENPDAPIAYGICTYDEDLQEKFLQERVAEIGPLLLDPFNTVMREYTKDSLPEILDDFRRNLTSKSPEELIERAMSRVVLDLKNRFEQKRENFNAAIIPLFVQLVIPPAFMKHPAFGAENEWRIAEFSFGNSSGIKFRTGPSSLVPYVAIPLPLIATAPYLIKRIVVGPSPKSDQAVAAVKMLLQSKGLETKDPEAEAWVEVVPSQIPYRNW
jgi:hypothetical protein